MKVFQTDVLRVVTTGDQGGDQRPLGGAEQAVERGAGGGVRAVLLPTVRRTAGPPTSCDVADRGCKAC